VPTTEQRDLIGTWLLQRIDGAAVDEKNVFVQYAFRRDGAIILSAQGGEERITALAGSYRARAGSIEMTFNKAGTRKFPYAIRDGVLTITDTERSSAMQYCWQPRRPFRFHGLVLAVPPHWATDTAKHEPELKRIAAAIRKDIPGPRASAAKAAVFVAKQDGRLMCLSLGLATAEKWGEITEPVRESGQGDKWRSTKGKDWEMIHVRSYLGFLGETESRMREEGRLADNWCFWLVRRSEKVYALSFFGDLASKFGREVLAAVADLRFAAPNERSQ